MSLAIRTPALAVLAALAVAVATPFSRADDKPAAADKAPAAAETGKPIDLVLCIDTSNSMDGLIDSAKAKLWDIVNEMARLKPTPNLRVALYSYGNDGYVAATGWVKKEIDLTSDLDDVYKALNTLKTGGGTELVARVTRDALKQQKWSTEAGSLKLIFVCGNEPVNQDKDVSLESVADMARGKGVVVNTIYCSWNHDTEIPAWAAFAEKCGGRHVTINQNKAVQRVVVKTEFDDQILKLNDALNKTYVAYGRQGKDKVANQAAQDSNALKAPAAPGGAPDAAIARGVSKAGALYRNAGWDLVDRMKEDKGFDITKLKEAELCDELKKLKPAERLAYVKKKAAERETIQKQITELAAKRQRVIDAELTKKPRTDADKALDEAVKGVVRDQAKARGFQTPPGK